MRWATRCHVEAKQRRKDLKACEEKLAWIRSQYKEILKEADEALAATPSLRHELEEKLEKQAQAIEIRIRPWAFTGIHVLMLRNVGLIESLA